jgi:HlyD family secretion protein
MKLLNKPGQLFRSAQNKIERTVESSHDGVVLQPSKNWVRATTWSLIGCTGFALGWLALAQTEEIVVAPGKLEPIGAVREVELPVGGVAEEILVKEGDQVKEGQALVKLDTEASAEKQLALEKAIELKGLELKLKELELRRYLEVNDEQQLSLQQQLDLETEIEQRLKGLSDEGGIGELQYLQQLTKLQQVSGQLRETKADRLRQKAVLNQNMEQLRSSLAQLRAELAEASKMVKYATLRSPVNGVVFDLKPAGKGFVTGSNEPVLKVVPFDKLQANVEVASSDIGFVRAGMASDLNIDSFPATDFGVLEGKVKQVGSDALPPDPSKQREVYRYPVTIQLVTQQLKLKSGKQLPLQVGMSLTAHIKLRKVTYLQLLLGGFQDKANSLRQI